MTNYYLSVSDYSEIRFLIGDLGEKEDADRMLAERGLLTEKGNAAISAVSELNNKLTCYLLHRLASKLRQRKNGFEPIKNTYLKMYSEKDYTGMYLLTVFIYGFVGWRTPLELNILSSHRELLKSYFGEFIKTLKNFESERSTEYEEENE